ncbi:biotin-dependent carboxyltransferase family protein [Yinghuangia soli]|uniref:Biotin-dependent carboxyltransferase family protein n=1 Tax=Yinghuangia soli TaxID=2908204 RepID=A0AA41TX29_9ACTN|nr:biotin-dependent carboxyltransferase family protein [Yinghuangia soli]MCF2526423.1 biotin-dependent carboxyltransferase family protein [Yinghuangia soli]
MTGLPAAPAHLAVVRPGALTTVQDLGRAGQAHLGVPRSGAADRRSHAFANRLVGNPESAATLETTVVGCAVRTDADRWFAVAGAPCPVAAGGRAVPFGAPFLVRAGETVELGPVVAGVRSYLAVGGGIAVPEVLGSRATDLMSGLGPAPLAAGAVLPLGPAAAAPDATGAPPPGLARGPVLRVTPGPRSGFFPPAAWELLRAHAWTVLPASNRIGVRLDGPALPRTGGDALPSEGMVPGALQVPPNGLPVLFLADHPTTGGYPVIGCVHPADLPHAAQAAPGSALRFRIVPDRW